MAPSQSAPIHSQEVAILTSIIIDLFACPLILYKCNLIFIMSSWEGMFISVDKGWITFVLNYNTILIKTWEYLFCWLLSFNIMSLRFIYAVWALAHSFFIAELHIYTYIIHFWFSYIKSLKYCFIYLFDVLWYIYIYIIYIYLSILLLMIFELFPVSDYYE